MAAADDDGTAPVCHALCALAAVAPAHAMLANTAERPPAPSDAPDAPLPLNVPDTLERPPRTS